MSKSETAETTEQATEQAAIHVETGGDLWRSTTDLLSVLVDECKVRFDASTDEDAEVHVQAVDPANVGMIDLHVPAEAFDSYEVPEATVLGLPLDDLTSITNYARKGGNGDSPGDPVTVEKVGGRVYARVEPEDKWNRTGSFFHVDPDRMRKEPSIPDLDRPWRGDVDASNLRDALKAIKGRFDYAAIAAEKRPGENGSLGNGESAFLSLYANERDEDEVRSEDGFTSDEPILHADAGEEEVVSLFSLDYLKDMLDATVKAGFDSVTVDLGQEFPITVSFTGTTWGIHGEYMLAPRISSTDGEEATAELSRTWGDRFDSPVTSDDEAEESVQDPEESSPDEDDEQEDETDDDGLPTCVSGSCENDADPEAVEEGYPFCPEHDKAENRDLYDDLPEESFEEEEE